MNIIKNLAKVNFTKRTGKVNEWIVIHYFGGLGSAANVAGYFGKAGVKASAHYCVDDTDIVQAVLDSDTAWHCGDSGRGTHKGKCTNANSIGIEVRPYKVNTATASASDKDWYFHEATIANLTELVRSLMVTHGIDADHVIRHYDVTAKYCPRPWMGDDINTYHSKTGNQLWKEFKAGLTAESEEEMPKYYTIAEMPEWARTTMQKLLDRKYVTEFGFTEEALRIFVINDRAGIYR